MYIYHQINTLQEQNPKTNVILKQDMDMSVQTEVFLNQSKVLSNCSVSPEETLSCCMLENTM